MLLWKRKQNQAAERELAHLKARVKELESILGLPQSNLTTFASLNQRLKNLQSLAATKIDPNDNGEQHEPILWGDPRYFK